MNTVTDSFSRNGLSARDRLVQTPLDHIIKAFLRAAIGRWHILNVRVVAVVMRIVLIRAVVAHGRPARLSLYAFALALNLI